MGKRRNFLETMMDRTDPDFESLPGQFIVEIAGENRILIENHHGVAAYGREKILVNVKSGSICVCGCALEIMHMSKAQLVICGEIQSVVLNRRR